VSFPRITLPVTCCSAAPSTLRSSSVSSCRPAAVGRVPGTVVLAVIPLLVLQQAFAIGCGVLPGVERVLSRMSLRIVGVRGPILVLADADRSSGTVILSDRTRGLLAWNR
jgi:hypothetical protein